MTVEIVHIADLRRQLNGETVDPTEGHLVPSGEVAEEVEMTGGRRMTDVTNHRVTETERTYGRRLTETEIETSGTGKGSGCVVTRVNTSSSVGVILIVEDAVPQMGPWAGGTGRSSVEETTPGTEETAETTEGVVVVQ